MSESARLFIYAEKATKDPDSRWLRLDTADGFVMVQLPEEGIVEDVEDDEESDRAER